MSPADPGALRLGGDGPAGIKQDGVGIDGDAAARAVAEGLRVDFGIIEDLQASGVDDDGSGRADADRRLAGGHQRDGEDAGGFFGAKRVERERRRGDIDQSRMSAGEGGGVDLAAIENLHDLGVNRDRACIAGAGCFSVDRRRTILSIEGQLVGSHVDGSAHPRAGGCRADPRAGLDRKLVGGYHDIAGVARSVRAGVNDGEKFPWHADKIHVPAREGNGPPVAGIKGGGTDHRAVEDGNIPAGDGDGTGRPGMLELALIPVMRD